MRTCSGSLKPSATVELEHRLLCNTVKREQPLRDRVAVSAPPSSLPWQMRMRLGQQAGQVR